MIDLRVKMVENGRMFGRPYGKPNYHRVYVMTCACGCGTEFEHPYVKKYVDRSHWYAFKSGKTIDELYGTFEADSVRRRLSDISRGRPSVRRGKTDVEILGVEKARQKAQKLSIIASDALDAGTIGPQTSKQEWVLNPFTQQEEFMHSSWETAFLHLMIKQNVPVTKHHRVRIKYDIGDGVIRTYTPDFVQLNARVVYEVKGHMSQKDVHKVNALKEWAVQNEYAVVVIDRKPIHANGG